MEKINAQNIAKIQKIMRASKTLVLSTIGSNGEPACAPVYYNPYQYHALDFVSQEQSAHISNLPNSNSVSGAIFIEGHQLTDITGLQVKGKVKRIGASELSEARQMYMNRFPEIQNNGYLMQMFMGIPFFRFEICWVRYSCHEGGVIQKNEWLIDAHGPCNCS